jgi:hypothetical protein
MKKSLIALAAMAAAGCAVASSRSRFDAPRGMELRALDAGGLLANIDSATLNKNTFMQGFGDGSHIDGKIALAVNPTAADVVRIMRIPAGNKVSAIMLANDDLDSNGSPTIVFSLGYAPVVAADGPAASPAYFAAAGQTQLQSASKGTWYGNFDAITFDKDVYLTATIGTASATFAAGSIWALALSTARGVK